MKPLWIVLIAAGVVVAAAVVIVALPGSPDLTDLLTGISSGR